jgi:hypothetical protein
MSLLKRLKAIDAFPKIQVCHPRRATWPLPSAAGRVKHFVWCFQDDFYSKTMSGGVITIVCTALMVVLFFSELGKPLCSKTRLPEITCPKAVHVARKNIRASIWCRPIPDNQDGAQAGGRHVQRRADHIQGKLLPPKLDYAQNGACTRLERRIIGLFHEILTVLCSLISPCQGCHAIG